MPPKKNFPVLLASAIFGALAGETLLWVNSAPSVLLKNGWLSKSCYEFLNGIAWLQAIAASMFGEMIGCSNDYVNLFITSGLLGAAASTIVAFVGRFCLRKIIHHEK